MNSRAPNKKTSAWRSSARTLLDMRETCENSTKEERRDLVHIMIQEVGIDVERKRVQWVKALPDYEPLFSIIDGMRQDSGRRLWIEQTETPDITCGIQGNMGQASADVKIKFDVSHNFLTSIVEYAL